MENLDKEFEQIWGEAGWAKEREAMRMVLDWCKAKIIEAQQQVKVEPEVKVNFAEQIYDDLIYDLTDRNGLKQTYWDIDNDIREEIKSTWIEIINNNLSKISA